MCKHIEELTSVQTVNIKVSTDEIIMYPVPPAQTSTPANSGL